MTCSEKPIICDEIFDENSLPSEQEVRDYAVRIGINPDSERHLLNIALEGLMSPLPADWKAILDKRINRIYYYNNKTHKAQWTHPLDEKFVNIVKKKRLEESISAGDDDSKTSIKEDLKSFEEAVTTSDMLSSRNLPSTHKSRLTSVAQKGLPLYTGKDSSPDARKTLNPVGRPPLPPKRRAASSSPKAGGERSSLSLRLSPAPSPTRIDIDSIGLPLALASPEVKSEKQAANRVPSIKLTGGGSAFLKSKVKQSASPSGESKPVDEPVMVVREAESLESPDDERPPEMRLKHSASVGESGFEKLIKSKRFTSLQESLLNLKTEMELPSSELKSPNTLRGILREKPSAVTKLWDVDPSQLTSEEKENLRLQEMKEERKQNVRFADIVTKPINIQFSKTDSEEESITNDSSNDLDDLILEHMNSDDEELKDSKLGSEISPRNEMKQGLGETKNRELTNHARTEESSLDKMEMNKNILSRLTDLSGDSNKKVDPREEISRIMEIKNNNKETRDWLFGSQDMNQNEHKTKQLTTKEVYDNAKLGWDSENNTLDKHVSDVARTKYQKKDKKSAERNLSSPRLSKLMDSIDKDIYSSFTFSDDNSKKSNNKGLDGMKTQGENRDNSNVKESLQIRKSKLMPEMDLKKVFDSVRENVLESGEQSWSEDEEGEPMQTSPPQDSLEPHQAHKLDDYKQRQRKLWQDKKAAVKSEFEENILEIQKELQHQEEMEKHRFYQEIQHSMTRYKQEIEAEKNEREALLRSQCEDYLKEFELMLNKDKETRIKKMKEDHEALLNEQEKKIKQEKTQFEEETKMRLKTSCSQLEKLMADLKYKEEKEIVRLTEESSKKLEEVKKQIEQEHMEREEKHRQELSIVEAEYENILVEKKQELEKARQELDEEVDATKAEKEKKMIELSEQHNLHLQQLQDSFQREEESLKKKHSEAIEALNILVVKASEKEDITQVNREFEKVRCEKRLLEDKYKSLKEKYVRLKNEVRLSMERKRQAKLNRQLQQQRDPASTTEDTTDRSTDHGKPPLARRKLTTALSSDEATGENINGTPKTIKRRPKVVPSITTSSGTTETSSVPPPKPKNVWIPSPHQRREGVSSAEDNHTSVSEEIQLEQDDSGSGCEKWIQSALSPLDNLRKQLEKLDELEEQFPTSVHTDTYLRYPFSGPAGGSCELDFYRHRLHLEREAVRRAKQALSEQRVNIESRQVQLRHKQHSQTLHQLQQEERELTDMEVSLHRTKALLGEKIIRLRFLEQSIERAATYTPQHSTTNTNTNTDSSGFSGSDLDDQAGQYVTGTGRATDVFWTENVLQSLENINSEIREIWTILGKKQLPGLGPPPMLNYDARAVGAGVDAYSLTPHRATDIADRTRRLKEWLIRTKDQQAPQTVPVTL